MPECGRGNSCWLALKPNFAEAMKTNPALKLIAVLAFASLLAAPLQAKLAYNKKAKAFDAGVTGCISCHTKEKPKKNEPLAERGQWLVDQKTKLQAKQVDLSWLKDYPNNGK